MRFQAIKDGGLNPLKGEKLFSKREQLFQLGY